MRILFQWLLTAILAVVLSDNILGVLRFPVADNRVPLDCTYLYCLRPGREQSTEDPSVYYNIGADCMRRSRAHPTEMRPFRVLLVGCSFSFGVGVSDEDTYAYRFNSRGGDILIDNAAVGGFGPYRSYLRLRRYIASHPYDLVIYAYIDDHAKRGSIPKTRIEAGWEDRFTEKGHRVSTVTGMPYTELGEGYRFIDHPLRRWYWPGDGISPLVNLLEHYAFTWNVRRAHVPSEREEWVIFANQVGRMAELVRGRGCPLLLMRLDYVEGPERHFVSPSVAIWRNTIGRHIQQSDLVRGDSRNHPGREVHRVWADNLYRYLNSPEMRELLIRNREHRQRLRQAERDQWQSAWKVSGNSHKMTR